MLWRTCHLHVFAILDAEALVVVASGGVSVSVGAIEAEAAECGADEAKVTLVSNLNACYTCVIGIHVLSHLESLAVACQSEFFASVVTESLDVDILDILVEDSKAYLTNALEVIVGREVEVPCCGRADVWITDCCLHISKVEALVGNESRILWARERLGHRSTHIAVFIHLIFYQEAWEHVGVVVLVFACRFERFVLIFVHHVVHATGSELGVLDTKSECSVPTTSKLLVETKVTCMDDFFCLIVACFFFVNFDTIGSIEIDLAKVILIDKLSADWVLAARHKSAANLSYCVVFPVRDI